MISENMTAINKQGQFISNRGQNSKIMVVDDQPLSLLHVVDLINYEGYEVIETNNSNEAITLAYEQQPDIILMDVMMPEISGLELSKKLKLEPHTQSIPILLMSVSNDSQIKEQALNIGVEDVLLKPLERTSLYPRLKTLSQQKRLNEGLNQTQKVLLTLATAIENRSANQNKASFNLANLVMGFAEYLQLNHEEIEDLVFAAYLHDIGTVNIPEYILTKKGKLTLEEEQIVRQHVIIGEEICQPLYHRPNLLGIIRHHHEKYDGSGYPDCLKGDEIPYLAQVFQIVDIYHALTSQRPYKPAYSNQNSLEILGEETVKGWRNPGIFKQFQYFITEQEYD